MGSVGGGRCERLVGPGWGGGGRAAHLRFHVQDSHEALLVDLPDRLELRAVHGLLVRAILQVLVSGDVRHHLFVRHEEVVLAILFVFLRRPRCVCGRKSKRTSRAENS